MATANPSPGRGSHALRGILLAKAAAGVALTLAFAGGWWLRAHGLTLVQFENELRRGSEQRFEWRSVDKKHWQALGPARVDTREGIGGELAEAASAREANGAGCVSGMVRVQGNLRLDARGVTVERLQDGACTDWISKEFPARCRTFDRQKIDDAVAALPVRALDYCMDRFEYPNVPGQNPIIVVTFHEAEAQCKQAHKRLCNEDEWTFACEGEDAVPYPYGYVRDATACVFDRDWRPFTEGALQPRDGASARAEVDRLWQGEPSGSRGACKSPYGVYDMTGNVDEWTRSVRATGYSSILKGGYWGPVRARCRPATRAHNENFVAYQQGFRCCAEADTSIPAPRSTAALASLASEDAGAADASAAPASSASASTAPASFESGDLSAEWDDGRDEGEGDELTAIQRARVGLGCVVSRGPLSKSPATLGMTALALAALGRRRRERRHRERGRDRR